MTCTYNVFCWFIHKEYENENNINDSQEVFEKIGIMEKKMKTSWGCTGPSSAKAGNGIYFNLFQLN